MLPEPRKKFGDYLVKEELGRGGMGVVFRVQSTITHREEAMKLLLNSAEDEAVATIFLREMKILAGIGVHPNIVQLYWGGRIEGKLAMLMQFVKGYSLAQLLEAGPLPIGTALAYCRQVLRALEFGHQRGIVHRDIKPSNIMVTDAACVKVMDFGIATVIDPMRGTQTILGSPRYMAPEQIRGKKADHRSDVYAVGILLYLMVTGKYPYSVEAGVEPMLAHLWQQPTRPTDHDCALPAWLDDVIMRALAKEPEDRFPTAQSFLEALGPETATEPPVASSGAVPHRIRYTALGACVVLGLILASAVLVPRHRSARAVGEVAPNAPPLPPPPAAVQIVTPVYRGQPLAGQPLQAERQRALPQPASGQSEMKRTSTEQQLIDLRSRVKAASGLLDELRASSGFSPRAELLVGVDSAAQLAGAAQKALNENRLEAAASYAATGRAAISKVERLLGTGPP